jgi:metallo-beta-lactamase class B
MYRLIPIGLLSAALCLAACNTNPGSSHQDNQSSALGTDNQSVTDSVVFETEELIIRKISDRVYIHTSFLNTVDYGKVSCNGMIVLSENEAIIFDTPATEKSSEELIGYLTGQLDYKITSLVATHFHADCIAGLNKFHEHSIPSYANNMTIELAQSTGSLVPQNGFDQIREFHVGTNRVIAEFMGEGHTKDNIIAYFPAEEILFGGCLIKETGAGEGNLGDAHVQEWPATVTKLKEKYPNIRIVIPGHGKTGGPELLDYTVRLFRK